jgi:hypothetical protein
VSLWIMKFRSRILLILQREDRQKVRWFGRTAGRSHGRARGALRMQPHGRHSGADIRTAAAVQAMARGSASPPLEWATNAFINETRRDQLLIAKGRALACVGGRQARRQTYAEVLHDDRPLGNTRHQPALGRRAGATSSLTETRSRFCFETKKTLPTRAYHDYRGYNCRRTRNTELPRERCCAPSRYVRAAGVKVSRTARRRAFFKASSAASQ